MPRKKSRKGFFFGLGATGVIAIAVVVALIFVIGGSDAEYEEAWNVPRDNATTALLDSYLVGDIAVRASYIGITGQTVGSGEQKWYVQPPDDQQLCGVSPRAADNTVVYAYGPKKKCREAAAINVKTGKRVWKKKLQVGKDYQKPSTAAVAIVGDVAVVSNGRVTAFGLADGEQKWTIGPANTKMCRSGDTIASGDVLLAFVDCVGKRKSRLDDTLVSLDPANGESRWKAAVKNDVGAFPPSLVSASPPVLRLQDQKKKVEFASLDDQGQNPIVFPAFDPGYAVGPPKVNGGHLKFRLTVAGDTLIGVSDKSDVVGVNLRTGQRAWKKSLGKKTVGSLVLGESPKGEAHVYILDKADNQERLATVSTDDGKITKGPVVREVDDEEEDNREKSVGNGFFLKTGDTLLEYAETADDDFALRAMVPTE